MGLSRRSSSSRPWSGSDADTGVPRTLGAGVGVGVGVAAAVLCATTLAVGAGSGVAVAGSVGRGVRRMGGLSEVGVGGGGGGAPIPHAVNSATRTSRAIGNRRRMR